MYDARFGGQAEAQVNMVTKSGTNQLWLCIFQG
jgi:hypothetical protein